MAEAEEKARLLNSLSGEVLDAAIEVHRVLGGPGLLESVYQQSLVRELTLRGLQVEQQVRLPVYYKGEQIKQPLVLDLLVDGKVIIEIKSVETIHPAAKAQLLTYLRVSNRHLGLLIKFWREVCQRWILQGHSPVPRGMNLSDFASFASLR